MSETSSVKDGAASTGRSSTSSNMTPLPENFEPGADDVICGRGKKCYNHIGNERFRQRVLTFLDEYSRAKSKLDKSGVLSKVVFEVRQNSPKGGFVKQDSNGVWFEVGDFLAREKTSQAFRDALHDRYKSSNLSKKKRRQEEQAKTHHQAYSKIGRSEYDISSRLERLSNEVIGTHGIDSLDSFNRSNYEMLARLHDVQSSRQPGMRMPSSGRAGFHRAASADKARSMSHFPDPLFGASMNTANAMPSEYALERLSPHESSGAYRSNTPQSLPISSEDRDYSERARLHNSMPDLSLSKHMPMEEEDKKPAASDIEPVPFDRINIPGRAEPRQKSASLPPIGPLKKGRSLTEDQIPSSSSSGRSSSGRLSKDLLECLDKMTYHSIADDNPFEPIPLTPQQEKANAAKQALSDSVTAELLNNPMDDSERCDEFAEG